MEAAVKEQKETTLKEEKKGKRKRGSLILNVLIFGGPFLVLAVIIGIVILFSVLGK